MKIEKSVELPKFNGKYPFHEMEVGDSFACENQALVTSAANSYSKRHERKEKFSVRKHGDAFRCWRIK